MSDNGNSEVDLKFVELSPEQQIAAILVVEGVAGLPRAAMTARLRELRASGELAPEFVALLAEHGYM